VLADEEADQHGRGGDDAGEDLRATLPALATTRTSPSAVGRPSYVGGEQPTRTASSDMGISGSRWQEEVRMGEVVYRSQVTVTRHRGPLRTATVPAEDRPVTFGVHGEVAEHYGTDPKDSEPHATTLDYLVAAAAG
jgi:hypothetical protein